MTTVSGRLSVVGAGSPPGRSVSLGLHSPLSTATKAWAAGSTRNSAPGIVMATVALATSPAIGREAKGPGSDLYEKIIITPRTIDLGFVLSGMVWYPEVWSTFRRAAQALTSVSVAGTGGLTISGGITSGVFYPGQAETYTASVTTEGTATIDTTATWAFTGLSGTDMGTEGVRITVFPPRMDWSDPFSEKLSWKTSVLTAYNGNEQRIQLRTSPRYELSYRIVTLEPQETALVEALLYGWHGRIFGIPVWPEQARLTSGAAIGAVTVYADTTYRASLVAGGFVMLWSDPYTWEALEVESFTATSITLTSPLTNTWAAGAKVVPLRRGRLLADLGLGRPTNWITAGTFAFSCEAV